MNGLFGLKDLGYQVLEYLDNDKNLFGLWAVAEDMINLSSANRYMEIARN